MWLTLIVLSVGTIVSTQAQTTISLAFFIPRSDFAEFAGLVRSVFLVLEKNHTDFRYNIKSINISRDDDMDAIQQFCQALSSGLNAVIDMTWGGWVMGRTKAELAGIPYIRVDTTIRQFVMATDQYLRSHNAADAALIFQNEDELDQSLYYIIGNSIIRVIVLNRLEGNSANTLKRMRPTPSYYVIFADTKNMGDIFSQKN